MTTNERAPATASFLAAAARALAAALAFAVPAGAYAAYVRGVFYDVGAPFNDTGLFAQTLHHGDPSLSVPALHFGAPASFFGIHLSPALWVPAAASWVLPCSAPDFFALFHGATTGALALAVFVLCRRTLSAPWPLALVCAWCAAFSGVVVRAAWNAHFEVLIGAPIAGLVVALGARRPAAVAGLCAVLITLREDAPLHAALTLSTLLVMPGKSRIDRAEGWRTVRVLLGVGALAFAVRAAFFPSHSVFQLVYSGAPAWAHLDGPAIADRVAFFVRERGDIAAVWGVLLVSAVLLRSPWLAAPVLAALPWLSLQLAAAYPPVARLDLHYGFPFVVPALAPVLAAACDPSPRNLPRLRALQLTVLVLGALSWNPLPTAAFVMRPGTHAFGVLPDRLQVARTEAFLDRMAARARTGSRVCATDAVLSLREALVDRSARVRALDPPADCAWIVSFRADREASAVRSSLARSRPLVRCSVPGTALVVHAPACIEAAL